ncbi:hypothetical protein FUAX_49410 (plasmid) [Fulvitalea axinellae]|uniref:6-bladed beta-propeller n=2 Tax=Fulvitalea axinellae TaxID=1182444 RepID=A0AAU9CKA0_9BACT|nr:hypothetical protein FUAX_49410 [Fulvitalea axinellae]
MVTACQAVEKTKVFPSDETVYIEVTKNKDTLTVCNYEKLAAETETLPLSNFVDTCFMVKLETRENTLMKSGKVMISNHFIGIIPYSQPRQPFKLYSRSGKYLRDIGSTGRGPGEYLNIHDAFLDEDRNCIYLVPWQGKELLRYTFDGERKEALKLDFDLCKSRLNVNHDTLSFFHLPLSPKAPLYNRFTLKGKVLDNLYAGRLALPPDFSHEVFSGNNTSQADFQLSVFGPNDNDTLYHIKNGQPVPVFTTNFQKTPTHNYRETRHHYIVEVLGTKKGLRKTWTTYIKDLILVDKQKLIAKKIKIAIDFYGGLPVSIGSNCSKGYFIQLVSATDLKIQLRKRLGDKNNMPSYRRDLLVNLDQNLREDDNHIVFFGKLK